MSEAGRSSERECNRNIPVLLVVHHWVEVGFKHDANQFI